MEPEYILSRANIIQKRDSVTVQHINAIIHNIKKNKKLRQDPIIWFANIIIQKLNLNKARRFLFLFYITLINHPHVHQNRLI